MMEETIKMIDLHTHILPGLDDGPRTLEESIEMCRISYQDGIRTIVATPHILPDIYNNNRSTILSKLHDLQSALCHLQSDMHLDSELSILPNRATAEDGRTPHPELSLIVLPGADVHFSSDLLELYKNRELMTVGDNGRYLMIEFDFQSIPYRGEEVLFRLITHGVIPIVTHPERNYEITRNPKRYYEMIKMGCLGQVTAMSLTGAFGSQAKRGAEKLLAHRLIHLIASDAHSVNGRPPILSAGVRAAEKIVGKEEARKMVTEYPEAIIEGRRPKVPEPIKL